MISETLLRSEATRRLADVGSAEIVVGIPTYKNGRTLPQVMRAAAQGLARGFPTLRGAILVVDGGSPDDTIGIANQIQLPPGVKRLVTSYHGLQGKGSAVRAVFEIARVLGARVIVILEADVTSITPDWVVELARPILSREYHLAVPNYLRALPDGALTDLLAYPLTRLLYGVDLRQPMGGEFAISQQLAQNLANRDVWETDVARHGIDIWISTVAIIENIKICQVRLGPKVDDSRELLLVFDPTFVQAIGTLFRMIDIYKKRWQEKQAIRSVPYFGNGTAADIPNAWMPSLSVASLADAFASGARKYGRLWRTALTPSTRKAVKALLDLPDGAMRYSAHLWARTVFDFAVVYNQGEGDPDKIVAALLPLYYARCATMMRETGLKPSTVEAAVRAQAEVFEAEKPYLVRLWSSYVPWAWEGVR